jgi:hypothetical protein
MSLVTCLPADVWMNIFIFLPQKSRPILSNVCALFDNVVHERLAWNLTGVPLTQKQVEIILESASKRNYEQFLVMFIRQCPKSLTSSSLSSSGKKGHACLLSAFFQSGCVESDDFYKPLAQAAFEGNTEVISLFLKNMWQNDRGNQHAAIVALKNKQSDFVKALIENQTLSKESMASILHNAITQKEYEVVASVLDLNYCHPEAMTDAIVQAAQDGALEILTLIISKDVCSEQDTDLGLAAAAENNRYECVELFIRKNRYTSTGKERAALQAVAAGHLLIVQYLYGALQDNEALVIAARKNRTPIVAYLLKAFAFGEETKEALKAAAESGSLESFNALKSVWHESDFLKKCKDEIALLAAKNGHLSILEAMNQKQYSQEVVHAAIFHNHPLVVKSCIEKKWVKEIPFDDLLESIKRGDFAIVDCLLNSCFQTLTPIQRYTLFNYAIIFFNISILRVIIEGPHFDSGKSDFKSLCGNKINRILIEASARGFFDTVKKLDPTWLSQSAKKTAFKAAVRNNQVDLVKFMLENSWVKEVPMLDWMAPLQNGCDEIVQVLMTHPSFQSSKDDFYSLLEYVTKYERPDLLKALLQDPRFDRLSFRQIGTLFSLSKTNVGNAIRQALQKSRRGYEFSSYAFIRVIGRILAWRFSILRQNG